MTPTEILDRYAAAWNGHDPEGVAACFGADGTYFDVQSLLGQLAAG
jgi:hypothetical protein